MAGGRWPEELPAVLWAYRTTPRQPTGETRFSLEYMEVVSPFQTGLQTNRSDDHEERRGALDNLEGRRECVAIRVTSDQQRAFTSRVKLIRLRTFLPGDLVLRRTFDDGKLKPQWEGPFRVTKTSQCGSYNH